MAEELAPGLTMAQFGWVVLGVLVAIVGYFVVPDWLAWVRPVFVMYPAPLALILPRRVVGRRPAWVYLLSVVSYLGAHRGIYEGRVYG